VRVDETFARVPWESGRAEGTLRPGEGVLMSFRIALAVFPLIFLGELPDKTMFASLVLATRCRPLQVWLGAAGAFLVHAAIATTVGVILFRVLPPRVLDGVVAAMFLFGAGYAWRAGTKDEEALIKREVKAHRVVTTAFIVVFVAEWGDLTQILMANLAAHYHSALSVGVGAVAALWSVAAIAVVAGQSVLRWVKVATARKVTVVVLVALAVWAGWSALR
jgi:putative Ca2+/H+ antiporter (TMEM165/GDT1 family)